MFIGVLAGSVFSGSGAFADPLTQATFYSTISGDLNGNYVLGENIEISTANDGNAPIGLTVFTDFTGTLDGANYTIFGLTTPLFNSIGAAVNINDENDIPIDTVEVKNLNLGDIDDPVNVSGRGALSNSLTNGGTVENVDVTGDVTGDDYVGGLIGSSNGSINNSSVNGDVTGDDYVGGLVGEFGGSITNSNATGSVSGTTNVGGLVGESYGAIEDSHATGNVTALGGAFSLNIGGLVGWADSDITNSYATGIVTALGGANIGGLVGWSDGDITDSRATGNVAGDSNVGGLVGFSATDGDITDSRATGYVEGVSNVGGLVGESQGEITGSWHITGDVDGEDNVGGLAGYSSGVIRESYATGDVTGSGEYIGGLVGWLGLGASISNSYANTGTVTGTGTDEEVRDEFGDITDEGDHGIGGLVGYSSGEISDSHAEGNVNGFYQVGGLVGSTGVASYITDSYATGEVNGTDDVGGLVGLLDQGHVISNSYATGDVTGDDNIGGLVGSLHLDASITNSYATGDVAATINDGSGDVGGLVGDAEGAITNSHASGDVTGFYDVGGLVGDLQNAGSITNSYATGKTSAAGSDGSWSNGWGGLVGESSGLISNSYATGNVVADYNYGSLIGYLMLDESLDSQIVNSFATGSTNSANNGVTLDGEEELFGLGGFVGCAVEDGFEGYSCLDSYRSFPETTPSILSVVNTVDDGEESAFEIVACKNNDLPSLSDLIDSYENTCITPSGSNRERRIRDFIQTTALTEIAKTLGFVISLKFPNDASIGFIKNEKELAISKILGAQKAADRVARTSIKVGEALQISYNFDSKDPIELWVKLPDGKWILAGVVNFDKNGKAVLPPKQFKVAGEYVLVLNKPSEESVKANAPLNQIGSLTVFVN